jgi:hypothetical protein
MEIRRAAAKAGETASERRVLFYGLKEGRIASIRVGRESGVLSPPDGRPLPAPPPASFDDPLPDSVNDPVMTRRKFEDYLRLFGLFDQRFVRYYHPKVVFGIRPAERPLHGREEILGLYRPLRQILHESIQVNSLVIDSQRGLMAAEITNTMTAIEDVERPGWGLRKGQRRVGSGVIFYSLADGMIIGLREL